LASSVKDAAVAEFPIPTATMLTNKNLTLLGMNLIMALLPLNFKITIVAEDDRPALSMLSPPQP
jgi:hypothetical protein